MIKAVLVCLSVFLLYACKKQLGGTPVHKKRVFIGITQTDNLGFIVSNDPTDWTINDVWDYQESNLFTSNFQKDCTPSYNYQINAYPNPGSGIFILNLEKPSTTRMELRLVDENMKTLLSSDSLKQNIVALDVSSFGIKDTVRLYYKLVDGNCEFRGHGDLLIQ